MLDWKIGSFETLSISELYELLRLRSEIFILEQDAPYQDLDNKDQHAIHIRGFRDGELVAYCRIFRRGGYFDEASLGRVVVRHKWRKYNYGHALVDEAIKQLKKIWNEENITISGQSYLKKFYESHGFVQTSEEYLEDGLPHMQMKRLVSFDDNSEK